MPEQVSENNDDIKDNDQFDKSEKYSPPIADPAESWNRAMFTFNDKFYFWILKPVAKGYKATFPTPVREGVSNFFKNLTTPIRFANCVLQGKREAAEAEFSRFIMNSYIGVLGFLNPAEKYPELNPPEEDLGQTLGYYGIGDGMYIVWPLLGPSSLRDSVGLAGDTFLNPVSYINPWYYSLSVKGYEKINSTSFSIGDYEAIKDAALDPYDAVRDAYSQFRKNRIKD